MAGTRLGGARLALRLLALGWALAAKPAFPGEGSFGNGSLGDPSTKLWVYACARKDCGNKTRWIRSASFQRVACACGPGAMPGNRLDVDTRTFAPLPRQDDDVWVCIQCDEPPHRAGDTPGLRARPIHSFDEFRPYAVKNGG